MESDSSRLGGIEECSDGNKLSFKCQAKKKKSFFFFN